MKKRFLALGLAAGLTALMTACGDETTNTDIINASTATDVDSLPKCDDNYEGMLATIPSKGQILVCSKGSWQNVAKTIQTSTDSSGNSNNESGCTANTLEDKSGVTIVCSGKKIATLKNGAKGPDGDTGKQGGQGDKGDPGTNGTGSSGSDLKLDETDCTVTYMGYGVTLYRCGDEEYYEKLAGNTANLKTWNGLNMEAAIKNKAGTDLTSYLLLASLESSKADGQFLWNGDSVWTETDDIITTDRLKKDFAIRAQAKLKVESEAPPSYYVVLEPLVGMEMILKNPTNAYPLGGFCLTYEAEQKMELIVLGQSESKVARVPLNASGKATTVNILPTDFKADSADAKVTDILSSINVIFIKAVGSLEEGEYENRFAVYEFGAYNQCSGVSIANVEANLKKLNIKKGTFTDKRDQKEYNTITIGDQTWFAQDLDYDYKVHVNAADDVTDSAFVCDMEHPCVDSLTYKFPDPAPVTDARYYSFAAAIDSAKLARDATAPVTCGRGKACTSLPETVQGICPSGWHLPSQAEYDVLISTLNENFYNDLFKTTAMSLLDTSASGTNWSGFSAKLSGYVSASGEKNDMNVYTLYWTSTLYSTTAAYCLNLTQKTARANYSGSMQYLRPIRCIKDKAK